jgi:predicted Co/Zn/Cd cation transporter (cation efflux family)
MLPLPDHETEQRALGRGKWANLFMGLAGVSVALVSNASALMLDGLFSGVNFLAAIFAARVAQRVTRTPDTVRPFGYEIEEAVYVMFRSLVLIGIILVAAWTAIEKIVVYATGGELLPVKLDWVVGYVSPDGGDLFRPVVLVSATLAENG